MFLSLITDQAQFFPSVPVDFAGAEGILWQAQQIAESHNGANRKLEIESYAQVFQDYSRTQLTFQLSYYPVVANSVTVTAKSPGSPLTPRSLPTTSWSIDAYNRINIIGSPYESEYQIAYQAGYDPTLTNNSTIKDLKFAMGKIAEFLYSDQGRITQSGVKEFSISGEYSAKFIDYDPAGSGVPQHLLNPFKRYSPHRAFA